MDRNSEEAIIARFFRWMKEQHPYITLLPWQENLVKEFLKQPKGSGKTTLLKLLNEFEDVDTEWGWE